MLMSSVRAFVWCARARAASGGSSRTTREGYIRWRMGIMITGSDYKMWRRETERGRINSLFNMLLLCRSKKRVTER